MPARKKKTVKKTAKKRADYNYEAARKAGLKRVEGHLGSRSPVTGEILKRPGHPTLHKSITADKEKGYQNVLRGDTLYSFQRDDPRLRGGSASAPRGRDLSGAVRKPRRKKKPKKVR